MAYRNDIFISYAREDDLRPPSGRKGWVTRFREELEYRLRTRIGNLRRPRIWWDNEGLAGNQAITPEIQTQLEGTMLMLALFSLNYQQSPNCSAELEHFFRHARSQGPDGLFLPGNVCRIFNILLRNFDPNWWPPELRESVAFPFCNTDEAGVLGDPTDPGKMRKRFESQMTRLVDALEGILLHAPRPAAEAEEGGPKPPAVLVLQGSDALGPTRNWLVSQLRGLEVEVLPRLSRLPESEHRRQLDAVLETAQVSVHLLNRYPGEELVEGSGRTYAGLEADAALGSPIRQVVWVESRGEIEEAQTPAHRRLLERLETAGPPGKHYRFVCGPPSELLRVVREETEASRTTLLEVHRQEDVLIDAENEDRRHGAVLMAFLENRHLHCYPVQEAAAAPQRLENFDQSVRLGRARVVLFGKAEPEKMCRRLERSLRLSQSLTSQSGKPPVRHFSFLPPDSRADVGVLRERYGWTGVQVLDHRHSEEPDPEVLKPLLALSEATP